MLIKKMFRTAFGYKSQFISMVIMIALGVGIFLGFNIEWKSIEENTSSFFEKTHYADYRLYSETGFSKDDVNKIKSLSGVDAASRYLSVNVGIKGTKKNLALNVAEDYVVSEMLITKGEKYNKDSDGIWLSDRFAEANDISIGDRIKMVYRGIEISGTVTGLAKSGENMICVADENQLMPDFDTFGFAYISPKKLENALGQGFYSQINVISSREKKDFEKAANKALGRTVLITSKDEHTAYAGATSEAQEGKTMGSILPVLFLAIAILTMVTTMHRIAANEKVQIGTFKALGFKDRKILAHYTSYGLFIGIFGTAIGIALGYGIAAVIISPNGMMSTYFDLPEWKLVMPSVCVPVIICTIAFLTLISFLSVKKMLKGTAADALRAYTPKNIKKSAVEKLPFWDKLPFGVKWNVRDIVRHKSRSAMTLVGGLGMRDTMNGFMDMLNNKTNNYATKVTLSEDAQNSDAKALADELHGDWQSTSGIEYDGDTVTLDVYNAENGKVRFLDEKSDFVTLGDDGVYLCLRLKDSAKIGDTVKFSPYGSRETYTVKVAGYVRSLMSECIIMSDKYADSIGVPYHIGAVYTDKSIDDIEKTSIVSGTQDKATIIDTYDSFIDEQKPLAVVPEGLNKLKIERLVTDGLHKPKPALLEREGVAGRPTRDRRV